MVSRERKREMYRRKSKGWYKHKDFILLDLFCMFLAFLIAYIIRSGGLSNFIGNRLYLNALGFVILADIFSIIFLIFIMAFCGEGCM